MLVDVKTIDPKKILFINTFGLGDVLFTYPFLNNLKANFPQASISYLGNRRTEPLLADNPNIDRVFVYERDEFNELYKASKFDFFRKIREYLKEIKGEDFDVVFDFSLNRSINFFTKLAGIPHRIGFNYKGRSPHLTVKLPFNGFETKHVVEYYLDCLGLLGLERRTNELSLSIKEEDGQWADSFLKDAGYDARRPLIGIIPGAGESWGQQARFRRWPIDNYVKLVDNLIENSPAEIILMGAKQEEELCRRLSAGAQNRLIEAYGRTTIGQLAALLKRCRLVILNDGGPLHIAAAAQTSTVSVFGPVDPNVYGPYGPDEKHRVVKKGLLCQPCYRRFRMSDCSHVSCLETMAVDEVLREVRQLL